MGSGCKWMLCSIILCFLILTSSFAQTTGPVKAKIVTWNIQMLPNAFGMFSKALRKKQRLREPWVAEHCNQAAYDVIVFQEVFDVQIKRKLKKNLKATYPYQVDTRTTKGRLTSNGVFIVSRIPMKYVDHVIYEKGAHEDGWAAKGCTLVEVEKEGVTFQIAGTHLQSGSSDEAVKHRSLQYQAIRNLLDSNQVDQVPVFMMGDMNTRKTNVPKYQEMLEVIGVKDFPLDEERPYTIDGLNSWNKNHGEGGTQLDYVLLQNRGTATEIVQQKVLRPTHEHKEKTIDLADHYGVVADVLIKN